MVANEMKDRPDGITVSAEVRWFFQGPCPTGIELWFEGGRGLDEETRDDRYVVLPGVTSVGIKLRGPVAGEGVRLEVKARHGQPTSLRPLPEVVGLADAWSKWTLVLDRDDAIAAGLEPPIRLLVVHKRRSTRRFVHEVAGVKEVSAGASIESGCDAELSTVTLAEPHDQQWWSLAFEAFGSTPDAWAALHATVPQFFQSHGLPPMGPSEALDERSSMPYPAWLAELA